MAAMNFSEGTSHEITIVNVANLTTMVLYLIFGIVNLLCLLVNLKVIHVVIVSLPQRRKRQDLASLLIAQLSLISIVQLAVGILNVGDRVGFVKQRGQLLCCVMGFLRTVLPCTFSTNMAALIYERVRKVYENENQDQIIKSRLFALVWILPMVHGILSSQMFTYLGDNVNFYNSTKLTGCCLPVPLFGNDYITLITEGTRFLIFHVGVCAYMAYALFKTRSKLHCLTKFLVNSSEPLKRKRRNIRFIYYHFVIFILFWIPMGILFLVRRTLKRVTIFGENASEMLPDSLLNKCSGLILMTYFSVNPVVNLYLLDKSVHLTPKWCDRFVLNYKGKQNCPDEEACEMPEMRRTTERSNAIVNKVKVDVHTSRVSTYVSSKEEGCGDEQVASKNDFNSLEHEERCKDADNNDEKSIKVVPYERVFRETLI